MVVKMTGQPRLDARHFFALSIAALALSLTLLAEPAGEVCQETVKTDVINTTTSTITYKTYTTRPPLITTYTITYTTQKPLNTTYTTTYKTCQIQYQPSPFFTPTLLLAFGMLIISVVELTGEGFKTLWD
jgi:hypothetical protein